MEDDHGGLRAKKSAGLEKRLEEAQMVRGALKQLLEPGAYERLMIVATQNRALYAKAAQWLIAMAQRGALSSKIDEEGLKGILLKISAGGRRDPKIEFRRKGE